MKRKLKVKVDMMPCGACEGFHAHWWFTSKAQPPSCRERQERRMK